MRLFVARCYRLFVVCSHLLSLCPMILQFGCSLCGVVGVRLVCCCLLLFVVDVVVCRWWLLLLLVFVVACCWCALLLFVLVVCLFFVGC